MYDHRNNSEGVIEMSLTSNNRLAALTVFGLAVLFLALAPAANAQIPGTSSWLGTTLTKQASAIPATLTPFMQLVIRGDYAAAGIGMRNLGYGTINITIPPGAAIRYAYLYFAYISPTLYTSFAGTLNGTAIPTPTYLGNSDSPCWGNGYIHGFRADVTGIATAGANVLANFPSGVTDGSDPSALSAAPLAEGATLVVFFVHPDWDYNFIGLHNGVMTFSGTQATYSAGTFTAVAGMPWDEIAKTTYIVSDGQGNGPLDGTKFNGAPTSGPGTSIKAADAFDGADGHANVDPIVGLWDTHTLDISSFFTPGTALASNFEIDAGIDCLTWIAQALSVKYARSLKIDIKPGSCPNPINVGSNGVIPVAILGSSTFNVSQIDPSTITLCGKPSTGWYQYGDVAGPFTGLHEDCMDCTTSGPDGYNDLRVKFNTQELMAAFGPNPPTNQECRRLPLMAYLYPQYGGTRVMGADIVRFIVNGNAKEGDEPVEISSFALSQNSPNPFNPMTSISYSLPQATHARLTVYDIVGREVAVLVDRVESDGGHTVSWNGTDAAGAQLPSGVYIYRLTAGTQSITMKLVIAR
jgi:hypothetical protein